MVLLIFVCIFHGCLFEQNISLLIVNIFSENTTHIL